ncbi:hypothetical protein QEJ31_05920 [Pigmentibacter sp. JX0631]|uniref:hypothetical protein n=1 Tax=Pigmentibacter sp. JX0631 TaxID=2976982 RepID=UPI002468DCEF|nr:hypothetical protein [Pigmentibacter sp. JX0631]WGL61132.1 hypothetical protein QEJ31_05920 [Pigmentibacter sp. JX0631]
MKGLYRKRLGIWGEETLDCWMSKKKWIPILKNKKIKRGEIDRIYQFMKNHYCIAEVKTIFLNKSMSSEYLFSENFMKKFVKKQQLLNLLKFANFYLKNKENNVFIRIFLVFLFSKNNFYIDKIHLCQNIKICYLEKNFVIISIIPEFTPNFYGKTDLEIWQK